MLMVAAIGAYAGHWYFEPLMKFICVGAFPKFVWYSTDAAKLARLSFTVASGLALACVPLGTLLAQRFARRSRYDRVVGKTLLLGVIGFGVAAFYYRYQMTQLGASTSEFLQILSDSKRQLILNPLTKIALASGASALAYGLLKGTLDYSASGK